MDRKPRTKQDKSSVAALYLYEELRLACGEQTAKLWLHSPERTSLYEKRDQCRRVELDVCPPSPRSSRLEDNAIYRSLLLEDMPRDDQHEDGLLSAKEIQRMQAEGAEDPHLLGLLFTADANLVLDRLQSSSEAASSARSS